MGWLRGQPLIHTERNEGSVCDRDLGFAAETYREVHELWCRTLEKAGTPRLLPYVETIRSVAAERKVPLIDTCAWLEHLQSEGPDLAEIYPLLRRMRGTFRASKASLRSIPLFKQRCPTPKTGALSTFAGSLLGPK